MNSIKMFSLFALTIYMTFALIGVTPATAETTGLCTSESTECTAIKHVHETSVGKAKLVSSIGTVECDALFLGDTKSATGNPLVISGSFTYTNCTLGGSSCAATEENGPAEIKVLKEGHEEAKVTGEGLIHLVCGTSIDCSYIGEGLVGTAKGPLVSTQKNGEVALSERTTVKETGSFLCPKIAKLDITTTPLTTTYIGVQTSSLCKADESFCAEANLAKSIHETSVGKAKLLTSIGTTECDVLFSGETKSARGTPLVISGGFTYSSCTLGGSNCTATEENGPAEIKVLKEDHETAKVTYKYLVRYKCSASIDCSYTGTGLVGTGKGPLLSAQVPDNGEVTLSEQSLTKEVGGFLCPKTTKLDITTTPLTATYITE